VPADPPNPILDPNRVRSRRLLIGLTPSELAMRVGLGSLAIVNLEQGVSQDRWTLEHLRLLADALQADVADLLTSAPDERQGRHEPTEELIGLISASSEELTPTGAAHALGVTPDELHDLIDAARHKLRSVNLTIVAIAGTLALRPRRLADDLVDHALARSSQTKMRPTEASVLHAVVTERDARMVGDTPAHHTARRRLVAAGVLNADGHDVTLSERTAYSLGLRR
jgi:transcriptional regulator with XRE-family HTH domain